MQEDQRIRYPNERNSSTNNPNYSNFFLSNSLNLNSMGINQPIKRPYNNQNSIYTNNKNPQVLRKQSRRTIQNGQYECQCPDGFEDEAIKGQVIIRNTKTRKVVYQGQFFNSEKCGYGIEYDDNENFLYEGEFRANMREGWGRTSQFEGQFKQDLYDGWGKLINSETFYEGYFSQGKYNSLGILIQSQRAGFFRLEVLKQQQMIQKFLLDELSKKKLLFFQEYNIDFVYIGQWIRGLKNGFGKLWRSDGYWYYGQFAYDHAHGSGTQYVNQDSGVEKAVFDKGEIKKKK